MPTEELLQIGLSNDVPKLAEVAAVDSSSDGDAATTQPSVDTSRDRSRNSLHKVVAGMPVDAADVTAASRHLNVGKEHHTRKDGVVKRAKTKSQLMKMLSRKRQQLLENNNDIPSSNSGVSEPVFNQSDSATKQEVTSSVPAVTNETNEVTDTRTTCSFVQSKYQVSDYKKLYENVLNNLSLLAKNH